MKKHPLLIAAMLLLWCHVPARSQDMSAMLELMQPGPEHELLKKFAGNWDMSLKMWMPGQPEIVTTGTSTSRMILGGRFLEFTAESGTGDMFWESLTILGFDRRHKRYTSVGYDTWGTYYVTASGEYDAAKQQIKLYGEDDDPVMGMKQKYFFVFTWKDDNAFTLEVIFVDFPGVEDEEYKMIEINYRRR